MNNPTIKSSIRGLSALDRRTAVGLLAGGAAAAAFEGAQAKLKYKIVRVRQNITTFAADPSKLAALKKGVSVMKQRSVTNPNDPTGWTYWASSHGTPNAVPPSLVNIYNQCQHGTTYFYPWHRAFLYYFEQVLRDASGDSSFTLPYWNWYSEPTIPSAFTSPANSSNPLWHSPRASNTVGTLSQTPFTRTNFKLPPYPGFSGDLEGDPHGSVHDDIGGDMGFINRSAFDPIFWLHHCNIDRLWNVWVNEGHSNPPSSDPWSSQSFAYNVSGTMKKTCGEVINTVSQLDYRYDNESSPLTGTIIIIPWHIILSEVLLAPPFILPGPGPVEKAAMTMSEPKPETRNVAIGSALAKPFALGTQSSAIKFALSAADSERVRAFASGASTLQDVDLVLDGVAIAPDGRQGGYSYKVCVAVPAGRIEDQALEKQCVGQFGSFEISVAEEHARKMGTSTEGGVTLRFPLGEGIRGAGAKALGEGVPVTFVARHANGPAGQGNKTYVTVKSARLELVGASKG
jgi:tyrosinase